MLELIFLYLLFGQMLSASLHILWFRTDLPVHVTKCLRLLRLHPEKTTWPDDISYKYWLRFQWETWMREHSNLPEGFRNGITCPGCMSLQFPLWVGAVTAVAASLVGKHPGYLLLMCLAPAWAWCVLFQHQAVALMLKAEKWLKDSAKSE